MSTLDPDLLTFVPLFPDEDEDTLLARWRTWANEGLDPSVDVDQWTDTREGSHWWVQTTPMRREAARIYDKMGTEVVAAAFPQWAWGEYLDDHGELRDVGRLPSTPAQGMIEFTGAEGTIIPAGTNVGVTSPDAGGDAPEYETDDTVTIPAPIFPLLEGVISVTATARLTGSSSNAGVGSVTALRTATPGVTSLVNTTEMAGGTDVESDTALRARILETFVGVAIANQFYYRRLALNHPGVGRVTVIAADPTPGDVHVIIATADGEPTSGDVVDDLQAELDPDPAMGAGAGQVGAHITVETATALVITVAGTVELETGYSLDGAGGTVALQDPLDAAVAAYVDSTVDSGDEVVYAAVVRAVMSVRGVHDCDLTLNGGTANVDVTSSPPKVPSLTIPMTLVEGSL